jgi:hypothetical protein
MMTDGEVIRLRFRTLREWQGWCQATRRSLIVHRGNLCGFKSEMEDCK